MRIVKYIKRHIILLLAVALLSACSNDDADPKVEPDNGVVTLRIGTHATANTRARTVEWQDTNAQDEEMMNTWVVVITNASDQAQLAFACNPTNTGGQREVDEVGQLPKGAYKAYSFANMSVAKVAELLGITITMPAMSDNDVVYQATAVSGTVDADKAVTVNGNGFNSSATDNGFGSSGIPMSNVQTIAATDVSKDLIVVRMLAKMKLAVTNETGAAVTIKYATIKGITANETNNLKLLPNWTTTTGKDNMEVVQHGDLQPNLNGTPAKTELTIPDMATNNELANNATREVTFYVNECATGTGFELTIGLGDATQTTEYRYALINNKGATTADDNKWNYIARNDYRIIPIVLDDYKFELIPYDFPPIGVYPVSVREVDTENHVYAFTFHDYGHFHLLPKVTKGTSTQVKYNLGSGDYWTLNTNWAGTWTTYDVKGGSLQSTGNYAGFYRNQTATTDGDEVGGIPQWYPNTSSPLWDPAGGTNYEPFIFGYIADPGAVLSQDKKIYHEMKVQLYVGGTYRRDMIYRFYMILDTDQMLYPSAARRQHHTPRH